MLPTDVFRSSNRVVPLFGRPVTVITAVTVVWGLYHYRSFPEFACRPLPRNFHQPFVFPCACAPFRHVSCQSFFVTIPCDCVKVPCPRITSINIRSNSADDACVSRNVHRLVVYCLYFDSDLAEIVQ